MTCVMCLKADIHAKSIKLNVTKLNVTREDAGFCLVTGNNSSFELVQTGMILDCTVQVLIKQTLNHITLLSVLLM